MRFLYLLHRRPAKAQASLRIRAANQWARDPLAHWLAAHVRLKKGFTEDERSHNLMSWLN